LDHLPGTLGTTIFFKSNFFPKRKIKNKKFKNEVIFKGFPSPEVRGKK
jgi:hypothetical protein